jgi:tetratricopeptide (TPR) repeat protein
LSELRSFSQIIESTVGELAILYPEVRPPYKLEDIRSIEDFYGEVMLRSLRGENEKLEELNRELPVRFADHPELVFLSFATRLRSEINRRSIDPSTLRETEVLTRSGTRWTGELMSLIASANTVLNNSESALEWFFRSIDAYEKIGCRKKAVRSRFNVIVAKSHIDPEQHLIPAYYDLYRRAMARDVRDSSLAANCLLNISREYQRMGALLIALKYADRTLKLLDAHYGMIVHGLALAHRCHLLSEMGRVAEAKLDYEAALAIRFEEVKGALEVVARNFIEDPSGTIPASQKHLTSTWSERLQEMEMGVISERCKLSHLEERLVSFLSESPRHRMDILEHLYGSSLAYETRLNRFKSLLNSLRKKSPSLIICRKGIYRLTESIFMPKRKPAGRSA